jgi:hypothetical protein
MQDMEWKRNWRFWQQDESRGSARARSKVDQGDPTSLKAWEERLIELGVTESWASRIAEKLMPAQRKLGSGSASALILGATLTFGTQAEQQASVDRNLREVKEVERLLGAFSGELEKLDEVLEVLAAYAQRMRNKPGKLGKAERRLLH